MTKMRREEKEKGRKKKEQRKYEVTLQIFR